MSALDAAALPESRLYTFIDAEREHALYFLEAQRLIHDLALLHGIHGPGFAYFRDTVLSVQPMIALIKRGEQLGFYLDSERPYFRLKIETGHQGDTRSVLVPERFAEFPEAMHGLVRIRKLFPHNRPPYESILRVEGLPLGTIVNRVLSDSYQVHCAVFVGSESDQSAMLHRLPDGSGLDPREAQAAVDRHGTRIEAGLQRLFARALHGAAPIAAALAPDGWRLLAERPVRFHCACSRPRMIRNIRMLGDEWPSLFDPGEPALEAVCEYCKTRYRITRDEVEQAAGALD